MEVIIEQQQQEQSSTSSLSTNLKLRRNASIRRKLAKHFPLIKKELENEYILKQSIERVIESIAQCNILSIRHTLENGFSANTKFNNWSLLHYACAVTDPQYCGTEQHLEVIKLLLEYGADVNAVDEDRWTPLHLACQFGSVRVISFLISKGADRDACTVENLRPIDLLEPDNLTAISFLIYTGNTSSSTNERLL